MTDSERFARTIALYSLRFTPDRLGVVEDMRFPQMRVVLRQETQRLGRPPTQDEFAQACILAWSGPFPRDLETPIRARLARAYASLVREHHFGLVLREICGPQGLEVLDSDYLDLGQGIDFAIEGPAGKVAIAVQQATRRAWSFANRKAWRRCVGWSVITAELGFENRMTCGQFWLFRPEWIKQFVQEQVIHLVAA